MPTSKYAIPEVDENHQLLTGPAEINAALASIDSTMAGYAEGTLGSLPAAGKAGRIYRCTDAGQPVFLDTGSAWREIAPASGYAEVLTDQSASTGGGAIDLATVGPSVALQVPTSGLVALRAEVTILGTATNGGNVFVREDSGTAWQILSTPAPESIARATVPGSISGTNTLRVAGWHVFSTTPGSHTYKLMYSGSGTTNQGEHFKDRKLWVRAVGT